ncbi:hypothetical protein HK101_004710, partial [Irineochytrium annulatum]
MSSHLGPVVLLDLLQPTPTSPPRVRTVAPTALQSAWSFNQVRLDTRRKLLRLFELASPANSSPDRPIYALIGRVFQPTSPVPFGGKSRPGYASFTGDTAVDVLDWVVVKAISPPHRGRGLRGVLPPGGALIWLAGEANAVVQWISTGDKDSVDESMLRGMVRTRHLSIRKGLAVVIPQHLRDPGGGVTSVRMSEGVRVMELGEMKRKIEESARSSGGLVHTGRVGGLTEEETRQAMEVVEEVNGAMGLGGMRYTMDGIVHGKKEHELEESNEYHANGNGATNGYETNGHSNTYPIPSPTSAGISHKPSHISHSNGSTTTLHASNDGIPLVSAGLSPPLNPLMRPSVGPSQSSSTTSLGSTLSSGFDLMGLDPPTNTNTPPQPTSSLSLSYTAPSQPNPQPALSNHPPAPTLQHPPPQQQQPSWPPNHQSVFGTGSARGVTASTRHHLTMMMALPSHPLLS